MLKALKVRVKNPLDFAQLHRHSTEVDEVVKEEKDEDDKESSGHDGANIKSRSDIKGFQSPWSWESQTSPSPMIYVSLKKNKSLEYEYDV